MVVVTAASTWCFYVLACADGSFYAGISTDVSRRLEQHNTGKGARYTRGRGPLRLLYYANCVDRAQALRDEAAFKALSRAQKHAWLEQNATTNLAPPKGPDSLKTD